MFEKLIGESSAVLNSQFIAIALVKDRHIVWANAAMHQMFGYEIDELIGQPTRILFLDQESYETFGQELYKAIDAGLGYTGTIPQKRKDGKAGWYEFNISVLSGHPGTVVGAIVDRTASYKATRELQERKSLYRSVVEDQTEVIARILIDGTILFVNEVFCRLFGKSCDELIGFRWQPIAHPDDVPMIEAKLQEMTLESPVVIIENRVFLANGEIRWMQFVNRGLFDATGTLKEIQAVGRDITLLKQVEAKLRQSEETLQHAQSVGKIGSFAMGQDTACFTISKESARLFGLGDKGVTTFAEWFSRVHPDDQGKVDRAWRNALQGAPYDITFRIIVAGHTRWIRALAELKFDSLGQPIEAVGICQDISDFKQMESDLRHSDQRLELALQVSGLVIWDWDISNHQVTAGNRWLEVLGYSNEELGHAEDRWMALIHPNDLENFSQQLALHLQGETTHFESEHRLRHKDGHWVAVEAKGKVVKRDKDFNPLRMIGTILDVTQRKRIKDESVDLLKRIESLISQSGSNQPANTEETDAVESLTKRQRQILGMIAVGMTSVEIAKRLNISPKTVISHRQTLMTKLDLHNTAEITHFAVDHHLLASK